jgi:hypothetical protein
MSLHLASKSCVLRAGGGEHSLALVFGLELRLLSFFFFNFADIPFNEGIIADNFSFSFFPPLLLLLLLFFPGRFLEAPAGCFVEGGTGAVYTLASGGEAGPEAEYQEFLSDRVDLVRFGLCPSLARVVLVGFYEGVEKIFVFLHVARMPISWSCCLLSMNWLHAPTDVDSVEPSVAGPRTGGFVVSPRISPIDCGTGSSPKLPRDDSGGELE